jgi:hypothetical protein
MGITLKAFDRLSHLGGPPGRNMGWLVVVAAVPLIDACPCPACCGCLRAGYTVELCFLMPGFPDSLLPCRFGMALWLAGYRLPLFRSAGLRGLTVWLLPFHRLQETPMHKAPTKATTVVKMQTRYGRRRTGDAARMAAFEAKAMGLGSLQQRAASILTASPPAALAVHWWGGHAALAAGARRRHVALGQPSHWRQTQFRLVLAKTGGGRISTGGVAVKRNGHSHARYGFNN